MATTKITLPDLFDLSSLDSALRLPSGTEAQRPASPSTGEWRYNTDSNTIEFWDGIKWRTLSDQVIPPVNSENFNAVTYTGNGSTQSITGVGFKPDFVWVKVRSTTGSGPLADSTRGTGKALYSNLTDADYTFPAGQGVTSFDSDGFSIGDDSTGNGGYNGNGKTYVAWCWKANGGTTTAGSGTNTTSVTNQVNTKAGFSISTFTGSASAAGNFTHGLGEVPDMYIVKSTSFSDSWFVWHKDLTNTTDYAVRLNTSAAEQSLSGFWNSTAPSSTLISLGNGILVNNATYVAYAFKSVAGYSSFGTYTGNGSTNGPIVNTGFEPAFVITKGSSTTGGWVIFSNKLSTANPRVQYFQANVNNAEETLTGGMDFLSNGFQLKETDAELNGNGDTFIYIAFASDASTAPTLADSFAIKNYSGNSGTQSITGLGFSPSWVWIKKTSGSEDHALFDIVRGVQRQISTNLQSADYTTSNAISSFDADGWTTGNNGATNSSGDYASWNWKANINPNINTDGTIQSVVSANQAAGFSIVKYTGNGVNGSTVGHGLGVAPEVMIIKSLSSVLYWAVYSKYNTGSSGNPATERLKLPGTSATATTTIYWDSTEPDSSVFTIGTDTDVNTNGDEFIAYCFSAITGFSKSGTYTSNASTKITTGFQPDFFIFKYIGGGDWYIQDSTMSEGAVGANGGDLIKKYLEPNNNTQQLSVSTGGVEIMSDGFYPTNWFDTTNGVFYMAFKANITQYPISSGYMGYLVVAGGAGGGYAQYGNGGGGGAGGLRTTYGTLSGGGASAESDLTLTAGTYTITVGAGGGSSVAGSASTITGNASISTVGGGRAGYRNGPRVEAASGGSGGGGFADGVSPDAIRPGGAGTTGEGFAGADSQNATNVIYAGGGGGAAAAAVEVNGGDALSVSITGSNVFYAGGGGTAGKANNTETYMNPTGTVTGGAGTSQGNNSNGQAAQANTGSGGGASHSSSGSSNNGGSGGSGIVVLRLNTSDYSGTTTGSPTVTTNGSETILTYTGSGTYVHS